MTVHLVYVKGDRISTPHAITNEVVARLTKKYDLKVYDWQEKITIKPNKGDILIGHPHPRRNTIYRNSFYQNNWHKRILMNPFAHAMPEYIAFFDDLVVNSDRYLAICGKYWINTITDSIVSHWQPWIEHLDLAINTNNFPFIKHKFNPVGKRRFLYIGHTSKPKGCDYLSAIADANSELDIGWIGSGDMSSIKVRRHGVINFSDFNSLELVSNYDFLLTCGRSDANPTTILEAAAWGLIPVCTPQSGYCDEDWLINIPLDNIDKVSATLNKLNYLSEFELLEYQKKAQIIIKNHYNWKRFTKQIVDCIESPKYQPSLVNMMANNSEAKKNRLTLKKINDQLELETRLQALKYQFSRVINKFSKVS